MATSASGVQAFPCELREVHIVERVDDSDGPPGVGGRETTSVLEIFRDERRAATACGNTDHERVPKRDLVLIAELSGSQDV